MGRNDPLLRVDLWSGPSLGRGNHPPIGRVDLWGDVKNVLGMSDPGGLYKTLLGLDYLIDDTAAEQSYRLESHVTVFHAEVIALLKSAENAMQIPLYGILLNAVELQITLTNWHLYNVNQMSHRMRDRHFFRSKKYRPVLLTNSTRFSMKK